MCQIDIKYPVAKAQWLKHIEAGGRALTTPNRKHGIFLSALKGAEKILFSPLMLLLMLKPCSVPLPLRSLNSVISCWILSSLI